MGESRYGDKKDAQARLDIATAALRAKGGDHALLDAAGVVAFFSAMTIMVDATGHNNPFMPKITRVMERVVDVKKKVAGWLLPACVGLVLCCAGGLALR